jgi:hypothetical protein
MDQRNLMRDLIKDPTSHTHVELDQLDELFLIENKLIKYYEGVEYDA